MTLVEVQVKWSVILIDRLGPDNFSTLQIKGHVLHRGRAHLKVPAWLLVWNALLTKKLPMFLSSLNEISGGCEKILPVSGSFWSNLKFFRMMDLTAWQRRFNESWIWKMSSRDSGHWRHCHVMSQERGKTSLQCTSGGQRCHAKAVFR